MSVDDLIGRLASDATPVHRRSVRSAAYASLAIGSLCSTVGMALTIGIRPYGAGWGTTATLIQCAVGLSSTAAGIVVFLPSLRPDRDPELSRGLLCAAILALAVVVTSQVLAAPVYDWSMLLAGAGSPSSPWIVTLVALPIFISLVVGVRSGAPIHLDVTGMALGMASGGVAAVILTFGAHQGLEHIELASSSGGILLTCLVGRVVGPRLLRW